MSVLAIIGLGFLFWCVVAVVAAAFLGWKLGGLL